MNNKKNYLNFSFIVDETLNATSSTPPPTISTTPKPITTTNISNSIVDNSVKNDSSVKICLKLPDAFRPSLSNNSSHGTMSLQSTGSTPPTPSQPSQPSQPIVTPKKPVLNLKDWVSPKTALANRKHANNSNDKILLIDDVFDDDVFDDDDDDDIVEISYAGKVDVVENDNNDKNDKNDKTDNNDVVVDDVDDDAINNPSRRTLNSTQPPTVPQPLQPQSMTTKEWQCASCTFLNPPLFLKVSLCCIFVFLFFKKKNNNKCCSARFVCRLDLFHLLINATHRNRAMALFQTHQILQLRPPTHNSTLRCFNFVDTACLNHNKANDC